MFWGVRSEPAFSDWIREYKRSYNSDEEYTHRLKIFADNAERVRTHNAGQHSFTMALNQFADLTFEEFKAQYLITKSQNCSATHHMSHSVIRDNMPEFVNWTARGVVSPVKNQGHCGSCWTFSTTGAMEAHMAMKYDVHLNLSEQQLVDCAQAFDNHGCEGGLPSRAFEYIRYNPGLMPETKYPYHANETGRCNFVKGAAVAFVTEVRNITQKDEGMLQSAVAYKGPVSIAYQVAADFPFYKSGVYRSTTCQSDPAHVNHAVLAVGYGTTEDANKTDYWIVKNSWGTGFGMEGYFLIERGKNMCGLADCASYPLVSKQPPSLKRNIKG